MMNEMRSIFWLLKPNTSSQMVNTTRYYFLQSTFNFKELAILVVLLPQQPNTNFEKPQIHGNVLADKLLGTVFYQEELQLHWTHGTSIKHIGLRTWFWSSRDVFGLSNLEEKKVENIFFSSLKNTSFTLQ